MQRTLMKKAQLVISVRIIWVKCCQYFHKGGALLVTMLPVDSAGYMTHWGGSSLLPPMQVIDLSTAYIIITKTEGADIIGSYLYQQRPLYSSCFTKLNRLARVFRLTLNSTLSSILALEFFWEDFLSEDVVFAGFV